MHQTYTLREKIRLFLKLLWPILITQVSYNAMTVVDTMMTGRAGTAQQAGVAVGFNLWMPISIGLGGIILAISPIIGQLLGGGEREKISQAVTQGLYVSLLISVVLITAGVFFLDPVLGLIDIDDPEVYHVAKHYLIAIGFGIIPYFASQVLRYFFDAQGYTGITMKIILLIGLPLNVVLNYLLIFGKLGLPRLGGIGAGVATAVTYWVILFVSILLAARMEIFRSYQLFRRWYRPSLTAWWEQIRIGVPIGLSIFFEASIFSLMTLLVASLFDTVTLAAHQVAMSFSSLMFMMPLSISMTLTIVVAYEVGSRRYDDARQYSVLGVLGALGIMSIGAVLLFFFREPIAYIYNDDRQVIELAAQFFLFAMIYQLSDASQASLQGILRGYKDVTVPFITALIAYWLIGIPSGYWLAQSTGLGPYGFWIGITIGLTCAAIGFFIRLRLVQRRVKQVQPAQAEV